MFTSRDDNVTHRQLNNRRVEALKWAEASAQTQASWWGFLKRRIKPMWKKWGLFLCHLEDEAVSQHPPVVHVLRFPHRESGERMCSPQYSLGFNSLLR